MKIPPWILLCCLCSVGPIYAIQPDFGPNVTIFDPSMSASTIQSEVDAVSQVQALPSSQFNTARHAFLFKPGTYNVEINRDDVIIDDLWAWRADHGAGVGWTSNTAAHGLIVNGDNVTAYGLFVEHYQSYEVIWNGENGTTIMFQNEMPYDPPNQVAWSHDGINGFASYKVAGDVR
jgi:hypothetical protein